MVKQLCISVSDEHKLLIDDMGFSPSGLFKQRMEQVKQESENYNAKIDILKASIEKSNARVTKLYDFLDKKGLLEEFNKEDGIN